MATSCPSKDRERERGRERGRNSVHARLSKNRTTPSSNDSSFLFLFKMLFVPHWKRGGRSKKTRDHVSFSLNPQQDARVYQCIRRVGHCGGLSGNFRSWEYKNVTLPLYPIISVFTPLKVYSFDVPSFSTFRICLSGPFPNESNRKSFQLAFATCPPNLHPLVSQEKI